MLKIVFMGAGSTVFAKNIIGDCLLTPALCEAHFALYDIDAGRLTESHKMLDRLNENMNKGRARITAHLGEDHRREALRDASYVVNAIQVGGYEPSTVIDFEIPKRYGLRQTIADTLGIGGIFRALRTLPVMLDFGRDMQSVCPQAWLLNYTNPMAILTGTMQRATGVQTVGLCHSVQVCAQSLLRSVGLEEKYPNPRHRIAGINHMGWLLEITHNGQDLYPEIKREAAARLRKWRAGEEKNDNMVRLEMMLQFGFYITESSEHLAEYTPYWIRSKHPHLVEEFNIPLDEYPRRCIQQIARWEKTSRDLVENPNLSHSRTHEYGSQIMEAIETGDCRKIGGNVLNTGLIPNLPSEACVEVPCLVDANGVQGCYAGRLPEQCAALCRTNINVQLLTIEAALTRKRDHLYQAAMLDPHTSAELSIDEIRTLCDDLIEAHGKMLPDYR